MVKTLKKEFVEFNTIREDYNIYKIENGQILKMKKIIADIVKDIMDDDKTHAGIGLKDVSHVSTPLDIDITGMEHAKLEDVTDKDHVRELKFTSVKEMINIYETEKSLILLVPKLEKVFFTNKIDTTNSPILRFTSSCGISIIEKKSISQPSEGMIQQSEQEHVENV